MNNEKGNVCIVLCSFNGKRFLRDQLESICAQSEGDWDLVIRDDSSTDGSEEVLKLLELRDSRVCLIKDDQGNLGAKENFTSLLSTCFLEKYSYFILSDQDDVWCPEKISKQLALMRDMESAYPDQPIMVHSDMEVVDAGLNTISPSFMQFQGIKNESEFPLHVLLAQNYVTGCTAVVNQKLLAYALPIPDQSLMHDWWLALCAATFGHIAYVDEPMVKYRQHGKNEVGAKHIGSYLNPFTGAWFTRWVEGRDNLRQSMKQAQALATRIRELDSSNPNLALVESYANILNLSPLKRVWQIGKLRVHAQSKVRQGLLLSRLLLSFRNHGE